MEKIRKWNENRKQGIYEVIRIIVSDLEQYELLEKVDRVYIKYHNSTFEEVMKKTYEKSLLVKSILKSCNDANSTFMEFKDIISEPEKCELGVSKFHEEFEYLFIDIKF